MTITIRYDTKCYFNVRSKADMSQLNLYTARKPTTKKCKNRKTKKVKDGICLEVTVNSLGKIFIFVLFYFYVCSCIAWLSVLPACRPNVTPL